MTKTTTKLDLVALTEAEKEYEYLTTRWLRQAVADRTVTFHRVGRRIYFDRADLEAIPTRVPELA